jgi:hypothetical protein
VPGATEYVRCDRSLARAADTLRDPRWPAAAGTRRRVRRSGLATGRKLSWCRRHSRPAAPDPALATGEWLRWWWPGTEASLRASTSRSYVVHVRIPLAQLSAGDVQAMLTAIARDVAASGAPAAAQ